MKKSGICSRWIIVIVLILLSFVKSGKVYSNDLIKLIDLKGLWKFSIGDDPEWAEPDYPDDRWEKIYVPSSWEREGFHGYNGFAWYRKSFKIPDHFQKNGLYLLLGFIDDVDEVYINGKLLGGSGAPPPNYITAYNAFRKYPLPDSYLNYGGNNVIAVRVYDAQLDGGIIKGEVGIYSERDPFPLDINLQGKWKFKISDNSRYIDSDFDDSKWNDILVPGMWENQGYRHYDGFAWYRRQFFVDSEIDHEKIVIVLGKIDDNDELYINGRRVSNRKFNSFEPFNIQSEYDYNDFRAYFTNADILNTGKINTIAVRVYDRGGGGGIYEGPVGIISLDKYVQYWRRKKGKQY
jgi:hypothetical protein